MTINVWWLTIIVPAVYSVGVLHEAARNVKRIQELKREIHSARAAAQLD